MPNDVLLFVIAFLTVAGIRLSVRFIPEIDIKIADKIIHHFWFGALLMALAYPLSIMHERLGIAALGAGIGLAGDQVMFMLMGGGRDKEYWKAASAIGAVLSLVMIFYFRVEIAGFLQ